MAPDAADHLVYYLLVDIKHREDLSVIRHWQNLKIAFVENEIWVKDFTEAQINSVAVKSLPSKHIFYQVRDKLYRQNSLLPYCPVPGALWTPIARGLPVHLPGFNHNFFGIQEKVAIELVPSVTTQEAVALKVNLSDLQRYLGLAPAVRLQKISWVILPPDKAILLGAPLLPIPGEAFWQQNNFLLPAGYTLNFPVLANPLEQVLENEEENWILWDTLKSCLTIQKKQFKPLSLSSFRLSTRQYALLQID